MTQLSFWTNDDSKVGEKINCTNTLIKGESIDNNITKDLSGKIVTKDLNGKNITEDLKEKKKESIDCNCKKSIKKCKQIIVPKIIEYYERYPSKQFFYLV